MNVFYEEDGSFKVGTILASTDASLQVEAAHGKRSKIKLANVLLRFERPSLTEFMEQAEAGAADIDTQFLWNAVAAKNLALNSSRKIMSGTSPPLSRPQLLPSGCIQHPCTSIAKARGVTRRHQKKR